MKLIYQTVINTLLFMAIAKVLPTLFYLSDWITALIAGFVLVLLNLTIKPLLKIISFPITLLTFGLFSIVINALTLEIIATLVPGFVFHNFLAAMLTAVLMSFANSFVGYHVFHR